jgi:hypothetical protein
LSDIKIQTTILVARGGKVLMERQKVEVIAFDIL